MTNTLTGTIFTSSTGTYEVNLFLNSGSGTTTASTGSLDFDYSQFSYSGSLQDQPYKEILIFKDGKFYISYDGFSYFIVFALLGVILMKTLIKITIESFKFGFSIVTLGKLGKK